MENKQRRILLIVDMQNDFVHPSGSLYVKGAEKLIAPINSEMRSGKYDQIWATQDWHPYHHNSFVQMHKGKNVFDVIKAPNGVEHKNGLCGVWYDNEGNFTNIIKKNYKHFQNANLPMPVDPKLNKNYVSVAESLGHLFFWFAKEEIKELVETGNYNLVKYTTEDYILHNNHWLVHKNNYIKKEIIKI